MPLERRNERNYEAIRNREQGFLYQKGNGGLTLRLYACRVGRGQCVCG